MSFAKGILYYNKYILCILYIPKLTIAVPPEKLRKLSSNHGYRQWTNGRVQREMKRNVLILILL